MPEHWPSRVTRWGDIEPYGRAWQDTAVEDARNVWDELPDWGGVGARRLVRAGSLGGSVWEFQPGQGQFVYHFHHASEELLVVLRGTPTVRMHDGDHQLAEGDVVGFPRGAEGGHRVRNDSDSPVRVLIVSTNADPDVSEYDSGKVGVFIDGSGRFFRLEDAVEHGGPE
jgi:uncharacterized cupin superfamily protein